MSSTEHTVLLLKKGFNTGPQTHRGNMQVYIPLVKGDEPTGEFWGVATQAITDRDKERIDWPGTKQAFAEWSESVYHDSGGKSYGNIRLSHSTMPIGKLVEPPMVDEQNKRILVHGLVLDEKARNLLVNGVLHSLSIGGNYRKRWTARDGATEYIPAISELSLCDRGSVPTAIITACKNETLELHKADGSITRYPLDTAATERRFVVNLLDQALKAARRGQPLDSEWATFVKRLLLRKPGGADHAGLSPKDLEGSREETEASAGILQIFGEGLAGLTHGGGQRLNTQVANPDLPPQGTRQPWRRQNPNVQRALKGLFRKDI